MSASKLARAFFQILESLIGTWQPPMPLHLFSPGASTFSLQPPRPAKSLSPAQVWALAVAQSLWPAQLFLPPLPLPLQRFRPRQMCGSWDISGLLLSLAALLVGGEAEAGAGEQPAQGGRGQLAETHDDSTPDSPSLPLVS